jgi:hypothetical protein
LLTKDQIKKISKWETRLTPVIEDNCVGVELEALSSFDTWIVTDFAKNLSGQFFYIIQPLVETQGMEGVTGLRAFSLSEEELMKYFELTSSEQTKEKEALIHTKFYIVLGERENSAITQVTLPTHDLDEAKEFFYAGNGYAMEVWENGKLIELCDHPTFIKKYPNT